MKQIWHSIDKWECVGMYLPHSTLSLDQGKQRYAEFLRDIDLFQNATDGIFNKWPISCEHFLTNPLINRIAWIGQASMYFCTGIPRHYRSGFMLLTSKERMLANLCAYQSIRKWSLKYAQGNKRISASLEGPRLFI